MPDDHLPSNPFKPQQPRIPGVSEGSSSEGQKESVITGKKIAIGGGIFVVALIVILTGSALGHWLYHKTIAKPASESAVVSPAIPPPAPAAPQERVAVGPGPIATTRELEKTWSSKRFDFRDDASGTIIQALVVHLPGNIYWGFSLREPYGTCTLQYDTDLKEIQADYNFTSNYPLVADPCNQSLFDLTKYGAGPDGLVRGQIVQGRAVRPPVAIEVRVKGSEIVAVRSE
ncbi:MAG TPA: hypothetical protein VMU43_03495 [Candidatus Acidoferrum sp.]|nr:hypothetical protein [Candidatus Acidoferrum sp.]